MTIHEKLAKVALSLPEIYLPNDTVDYSKWAVIACDQFTSEHDYWEDVEKITEDSPSTLKLIYPECYLEEENPDARIANINKTMKSYIDKQILNKLEPGFILVKRDTPLSPTRYGLMAAIDLEAYDYSKESTSLVRATEGTILERIPPRIKIRKDAVLEFPHIMVLIDDPCKTVIEPLVKICSEMETLYDFDLMKGSGHITGYKVNNETVINQLADALIALNNKDAFQAKYGLDDVLLYAMGDGNHSLATAKAIWEQLKEDHAGNKEIMQHPSRWALVELTNIYDDGLLFEPIHRVLFKIDEDIFFQELTNNNAFSYTESMSLDTAMRSIEKPGSKQQVAYQSANRCGLITVEKETSNLAVGSLQNFLDAYVKKHGVVVDYIHGTDSTSKLGKETGNIGFFLPPVNKDSFFETVVKDGALPRKTFSMGEAIEKRFYIEGRRILT